MEFRSQEEEISTHIDISSSSSPLNYNNHNNSGTNLSPNPNHSLHRIASGFSSPRPTTGVASVAGTSSRNGHQNDPIPQTGTKLQPNPNTPNFASSSTVMVTYHECLKNHAAALGGHVLDGCGEFMPDPENPLQCAACTCHRSFHRKDFVGTGRFSGSGNASTVPLLLPPPTHHPYSSYQGRQYQSGGLSGGTTTESCSEERIGTGLSLPMHTSSKKRHRTKFTPEQKNKMLAFAEKIGWRILKQDEQSVERFCGEVGVRRQVLKVWMHNNRHIARKQDQQSQGQQSPNQQLQ